jgi:mannose-6-phosphate isomerase
MIRIHELTNTVQTYAWGSRSAIPALLGKPAPSESPQAELWMGAHPKAPSTVRILGEDRPLGELIQEHPAEILGRQVAKTFGNQLPYLFKVLAAERPLSIQAHPDVHQAKSGFIKENTAAIPLQAFHRNYKDDRPKPELICALTPFSGLCGFRKIPEILNNLNRICPRTLHHSLQHLQAHANASGLKTFFRFIMGLDREGVAAVVQEALSNAKARENADDVSAWIVKLAAAYSKDIGVISPAMLNLIHLRPGEGLFLPTGELHAYLHGVGIELMANSDNVLRGGLTAKHVDVAELMQVLTFQEKTIEILRPEPCGPHESYYRTPAVEFVLFVVELHSKDAYQSPLERSAEILLVTEGGAKMVEEDSGRCLQLRKGMSVIVPAAVTRYRIQGKGVLYKAAVPL